MKKYLKSVSYSLILIIVLILFITILNYIGLIYGIALNSIKLIVPIIAMFIGGIIIGKSSIQKGWLNGIKIGLIVVFIFFVLSLITKYKIDIKMLLYYLIIIISSILGSMVGISKNKT